MQVSNPRRILAVSLDGQADHLSRLVKDLTGSKPESTSALAGSTHTLSLKTQYYSASVPVWLDLIASPSEWASSFLSDEAAEVLAVLGGLILVFGLPSAEDTSLEQVREVIDQIGQVVSKGLGGWEWDGVRLAVGVGDSDADEWDELCAEAGLEFVQLGGSQPAVNEFGEKTGIARVREALESNDWAQGDAEDLSDFGEFKDGNNPDEFRDDNLAPENLDFGYDPADFEGLKKAIWEAKPTEGAEWEKTDSATSGNPPNAPSLDKSVPSSQEGINTGNKNDEDMTKMENMMRKLQAVREAGEGLPEAQRKRMAARAVQEVMREL